MKTIRNTLFILAAVMLTGCATTSGTANPKDPLEPFNRSMFAFNDGLDKVVIKPVVTVYTSVFPDFFRTGVSNFFSNIGDVWIGANNLLQGKPKEAVSDIGRVLVNSTIGLLGFLDPATDMGLQHHNEDFGQTLAVWGVGSGAYVVLPVFGPRTVRDSFGLVADVYANPVGHISYVPTRNTMEGVQFLDIRASYTDASNLLDTAALDRYTFVRESYLQRRRNLIYDGDPPPLPRVKDEDDDAPAAKPADKPAAPTEKRSDAGSSMVLAEAVPVPIGVAEPVATVTATVEPALRARSVAYPIAVPALPDLFTVQPVERGAISGSAPPVSP